ncbi:PucR family transcriptional regulator [Romboutsia sp. 1001713B170207_170306_H8]|uniref:PucR family transcriptional regulator n=1 Tax=Romboutsia sp. 1001713B170207_170306_H8 TaxID=2787112 RepID=UPI000821124F|nr:PucR family transcriptional regulator [Romboutsia sp. 1001713B170207_170306_H8]SCH84521.1 Sugar diacid regulator [uncultured Clostridium sp.]
MSISIEYLYKDIKKHDVKLIAGERGLNNKVRWTHIVESEEIASFLQGEEIVFTTGVSINNDTTLLNIIKITKNQNASGIVVNTGKYIKEISKEVIDYCNENNYPLFVMPWNIRIPDVMRDLTITILESERTYAEISNAIKDAIFLPTHEELYIQTLEKVGFKCDWDYIVSIIELEANDDTIKNIPNHAERVKSYIEDKLSYIRNNYFTVNVGKSVIIVFYNKTDLEVDKILKKLYVLMDKDYKMLKFYVGIGKHTNNLKNLYRGYEEAKNVAKINRLIRNNNVHIRYSEVAIYRLLLGMDNKDIIKEFHDETIGDLEVYDKVNNTDYVELLISYFENNCKINETAKSLYLHRNTVNYKINKIEEILDLNLDDIGDKSKIYLSLMIRYLL